MKLEFQGANILLFGLKNMKTYLRRKYKWFQLSCKYINYKTYLIMKIKVVLTFLQNLFLVWTISTKYHPSLLIVTFKKGLLFLPQTCGSSPDILNQPISSFKVLLLIFSWPHKSKLSKPPMSLANWLYK